MKKLTKKQAYIIIAILGVLIVASLGFNIYVLTNQ